MVKGILKMPSTLEESTQRKLSVITINNNDNGCFFHALAVCKGKIEINDKYKWQCMRRDTKKISNNQSYEIS